MESSFVGQLLLSVILLHLSCPGAGCPEFGAGATEYVLWRRLVIGFYSMCGIPPANFYSIALNAEPIWNLMTSSGHVLIFYLRWKLTVPTEFTVLVEICAELNSFIVSAVVAGSCFQFLGVVTVIVYNLYTLDNAGHGFDYLIAQVVLFTSRRELTKNVGFKCRTIKDIYFIWPSTG
jgi:hypothetical protein